MALPNYIVQKIWTRAQAAGTDIMLWSDFLQIIEELRNEPHPPDFAGTLPYVTNKLGLPPLPTYANDGQAQAGGLTNGKFYKTSAGVVHQLIIP